MISVMCLESAKLVCFLHQGKRMKLTAPTDDTPRRILENLNTAVLLFNAKLKLVYINPMAESLLAVSARKVAGSFAGDLVQCPGETAVEALQRVQASGQPITEREIEVALADGRRTTVDCTISPLSDSGLADYLLMELQEVERQLRISREEQLLSQQEAVRFLVRGLAHEIKNPLGGLRGAAQLLERELPDDSLREYTRIIIDEADRLQALVDRMPGREQRHDKQMYNVHEGLERVRLLVQAAEPGLTLRCDYDPSIPEIMADPDQLVQAFLNLVQNAAQSLGDSGEIRLVTRIERGLTIGLVRHKLVARIQVIDNGAGIPDSLIDNIFYPMVTGRAEGSGLGLPIAQSIVHQHNGLIECSSRPGRTEFTILLPIGVAQ